MSREDKQLERKLNNMLTDLKEIHIECGGVEKEKECSENRLEEKVERYLKSKKDVRSKVELKKEILDSNLTPLEKQELVAKISPDIVVKDAIEIEIMERRSKSRKNRKHRKEMVNSSSQQEQIFEDKVSTELKAQDEILEEINKGLSQVKELAVEANKHMSIQKSMLGHLENKMDTTTVKLKSSNKKLQEMLEASGGCSRWCPMIMCSMILLGLVGTIFKIF